MKAGLVSRCEPKSKKSRDNILKFSFLMMQLHLTRSKHQTWNLDKGDSQSSDIAGTGTVAGLKWSKPTVNRQAPLHKQNLNKLQRNATKQSDAH